MASMDTQSRQPPGAEPPASATEPVIRSPYWRLVRAVRAVADADPAQIEAATRQFGQSRRYLTPVAWAAGSIVLLVRGIKLLCLNWRLTLIELVPAAPHRRLSSDLSQHSTAPTPCMYAR